MGALSPAARRARRIGVYGGSFDPPHLGHLFVARTAAAAFGLDHVLFVPAARPPHKPSRALAPGTDRLAMLGILLRDEPKASVWDGELERGGEASYTLHTVRELLPRLAEGARVYLILGSDNLAGLPQWHGAEELFSLVRPIVVARRGARLDPALLEPLSPALQGRLEAGWLAVEPFDASSSALRRELAEGPPSPRVFPEALWEYVRARGIYGAR